MGAIRTVTRRNSTTTNQRSRTQRKLILVVALSGVFEVRAATRYRLQYDRWQRYEPPFISRARPSGGPVGFTRVVVKCQPGLNQSEHHSHALPTTPNNP